MNAPPKELLESHPHASPVHAQELSNEPLHVGVRPAHPSHPSHPNLEAQPHAMMQSSLRPGAQWRWGGSVIVITHDATILPPVHVQLPPSDPRTHHPSTLLRVQPHIPLFRHSLAHSLLTLSTHTLSLSLSSLHPLKHHPSLGCSSRMCSRVCSRVCSCVFWCVLLRCTPNRVCAQEIIRTSCLVPDCDSPSPPYALRMEYPHLRS